MSCKAYREEIEEVELDGALGGGAQAHVGACQACADFYHGRAALRRMIGEIGRVSAPADFEFRLRGRMRYGHTAPHGGFISRLMTPAAATAFAACLALAVTALVYLRQPAEPQQVSSATQAVGESGRPAHTPPAVTNGDAEVAGVVGADGDTGKVLVRNEGVSRKRSSGFSNRAGRDDRAQRRSDSSLRIAPVINAPNARREEVALVDQPVSVKLSPSKHPMRVVLRDESGAERVLSMRAVSFGSQELGRMNFGPRASAVAKEGVW